MRFKRNLHRFGIERHRYAPELNRLHVGSREFKAEGRTFKEMQRSLGWVAVKPMIHCTIRVTYPPRWSNLNRALNGTVSSRVEALAYANQLLEQQSSGNRELIGGGTLPIPNVTVRTRLVWL